jgi:hypothetical protein
LQESNSNMKHHLILLFLAFAALGQAQTSLPLVISVYDNATLLPGGDEWVLAGLPIHPGITVGTEFYYNKSERNRLLQTVRLGYHYHRYMQHAVHLYTEFGYRRTLGQRWDIEARLGGGYLHAFTAGGLYKQNPDGQYEKKPNWGRPQGMVGLSLGPGFRLNEKIRLFLNYQFYMQTPFVPGYVPLLPNTALHLGICF